ncbi:NUDIX domain-containing protein [Mollicutes bacterium LVI A0039]|nr:NUDIX domain-containing protein [Mollicutes bacterium LVI A0039]
MAYILDSKVREEFDSVLIILFDENDNYVMCRNKNRSWEFPGGKREADETITEVAIRESLEETGWSIKDIVEIGSYILADGHVTNIVKARTAEYIEKLENEIVQVEVFAELPSDLSFQDGIYQQILAGIYE